LLVAATHLDRHTYGTLITSAATFYGQGCRRLQIDLRQTVRIEQSGLFALYCVHLIFQGERPPDPAAGMAAIREVTERVTLDGHHSVSLCNVPSHLIPLIERAGFERKRW
jgi:ABC-type transporter Mla MlaB component